MDLDLTKRWIKRWEGTRPVAYDDATGESLSPGMTAMGNPTIGVGLNLNTTAARMTIASLGLDYANVLSGAVTLTEDEIEYILSTSITTALSSVRSLVPNFDYLPDNQQLVLADLAFDIGEARLAEFTYVLSYVRRQLFATAAAALQESKWFRQVGAGPHQRGGADVAVLGNMANPEDILG